jgi:hypothetical protein
MLPMSYPKLTKGYPFPDNPLFYMVGTRGFEPPTPPPPAECATRLRYVPNLNDLEVYAGMCWLLRIPMLV